MVKTAAKLRGKTAKFGGKTAKFGGKTAKGFSNKKPDIFKKRHKVQSAGTKKN